ncbi:hypothetical protein LZC95_43705 [Pendulispora brunnea]|uniref:DUF5050 domain-containing protein n=1 Tax=Pendulispora brunnea TaxID=2905690 RepID=A0ABZ2K3R3_9BACT
MFARGWFGGWTGAAVLLALSAAASEGCDEVQRKKELTAATESKEASTAASASTNAASATPLPKSPAQAEKVHTRTVVARFKKPKGLAVSGGSAFVMDALSGDKDQNEVLDLLRVPVPAGGEPVRVATKLRSAGTPVIVKDDVFFATGGDKPNGAADRLVKVGADASGAAAAQVAPKALALADPAVASDGTNLYYLAAADDKAKVDVMRIPAAGGKPTKVATGDRSARVLFIAADAKYVYWPEAGRLVKAPVGGGEPKEVAKVVYAWAAASDGNYLYWSDSPGENMGTIRRIKLEGPSGPGTAVETLASGFSFPVGLALDDKSVFFVNYDAEDGAVYRVAKTGGTTATLIRGQKHPKRIAVDERHVYWINVGEGTLSLTDK